MGDQTPASRKMGYDTHASVLLLVLFIHSTNMYCASRISKHIAKSWGNYNERDSLCPPEVYSPVAHFYHLCLLNPTGLCSAASLPLPISGVLGGLTELMQQKGHKPRLAPRQRLKKCELLVTAATLFQQDHIQVALHSRIYCHLFATPVPKGCPQSPLSHLLEGEDLVCKYSIRKPKDLTGAETPHEVLEIFSFGPWEKTHLF